MVTRPPGRLCVPERGSPDVFGLMEATSKAGADGV